MLRWWQLKIQSCHDANFVVTGGTGGCRYDNIRCHQWRQSWCQLCRHWWYRRLSLRQHPVPPVTPKLALWRLSVLGAYWLLRMRCDLVLHAYTRNTWYGFFAWFWNGIKSRNFDLFYLQIPLDRNVRPINWHAHCYHTNTIDFQVNAFCK